MAIIVSDGFAGSDGQTLQAYSANWVKTSGHSGDLLITGQAARNGSAANASYYRSDAAPGSADYSVSGDIYNGAGVPGVIGRCSTSANTFYSARISSDTAQLYKFVNGSATLLGSAATGLGAGLQTIPLRLEMVGTAIKVYISGSATALINVTDSAIAITGKPGVRQAAGTPYGTIDNFSVTDTSGAGAKTLTAEAGVFSLATPVVGVRVNRVLREEAGVFAANGVDAGLSFNRVLLGGAGVFALAGAPGELKAARAITAGAGSFAIGATTAPLLASRAIQVQAAAFALDASPATLVHTPVDGPGEPTYTLLGGAGAFAAILASADLKAARRLQVQSEAFAVSASAAGVFRARRMDAAPAAFVWQGLAANLHGARRLGAAPGAFVWAGPPVNFQASGAPEPTAIDAATVPGHIVFSGYRRVVAFHGGSRVVVFDGNNNRVRF